MSGFRQHFAKVVREAVHNCIDYDDDRWARQVATMFETYSLFLRAHYGGKPKWAPHLQEMHARLRLKREKEQTNGN